jgi:Dolichyl-phosphate-mannose-protein mannosyltransferase
MTPDLEHRWQRIAPTAVLASLIILALGLRFWRLGDWNFESTEIFTLRDSLRPRLTNPRPLIYLLNYHLVRPFHSLDEFGLRLLPAIFGVLAIPAFYWVNRGLLGTRASLFGALVLSLSALHVFHSQFARYWSLVFLLSAVYPYAIYRGIREADSRLLALGIVTGVLAVLAHPVSILLVGGPAIWLLAVYLRPSQLSRLWSQRTLRWGVALAAVLLGILTVRLIPVFQGWIAEHDKAPGSGQFLLRAPGGQGLKQILYLVGYVESLTPPVALAGAVGVYLIWRERDRTLALLLISLGLFPVVFLALVSFRTPVSQYYLLPAIPVVFMGAGVFLDRLFEIDWKLRPRWLIPVTLTLIILSAGAPTLLSQYRDGRRWDFRSVARWMVPRLGSEDPVFSDQPLVLAHYLPGHEVQRLREPEALVQTAHRLRQAGRGVMWIVLPAPSHAFRTSPLLGTLSYWMYENCQLRNTVGVGGFDFRQQYLQVYRCPPTPPRDLAASSP